MESECKGGVVYKGKVPFKVKSTFAIGAIGKDLVYGLMATLLFPYYVDVLKVNPAFVGVMFMLAKIWDAFNDIIMGVFVDNTRSKWGKFVPWLTAGTAINALVTILVFTDFHLQGAAQCAFVAISYVLWGMTYTLMDIPYWAVIPSLTSDPRERESVSVWPRVCASLAQSLLIAALGPTFISKLGGGISGHRRFAILIAVTFVITLGITVIYLPKRSNYNDKTQAENFRIRDVVTVFKKNDQLKWVVLLILFYNVGFQSLMSNSKEFFNVAGGGSAMIPVFMVGGSIAEVIGLILFPMMIKLTSRKTTFLIACVTPAVGMSVLLIASIFCPNAFIMVAAAGVITKFGVGLEMGIATVFLADVVDYGQYVTGVRTEGLVFALQTWTVKFAQGFVMGAAGVLARNLGYIPTETGGVEQTPVVMGLFRFLMCGLPIIFIPLAFMVYYKFYKLNDSFMEKVTDKINEDTVDMVEEAEEAAETLAGKVEVGTVGQ